MFQQFGEFVNTLIHSAVFGEKPEFNLAFTSSYLQYFNITNRGFCHGTKRYNYFQGWSPHPFGR